MTDSKDSKKKNVITGTLEEIKELYGMPDIVPADLCKIVKMLEDKDGNTWVFFDPWNNRFVYAYAARIKIEGQSIKILLRAEGESFPAPALEEGDIPVISRNQWLKEQKQIWPDELIGKGQDTVMLPFYPDHIEIVDSFD